MQFCFLSLENACSLRTGISGLYYSQVSQRGACDVRRVGHTLVVLIYKQLTKLPVTVSQTLDCGAITSSHLNWDEMLSDPEVNSIR